MRMVIVVQVAPPAFQFTQNVTDAHPDMISGRAQKLVFAAIVCGCILILALLGLKSHPNSPVVDLSRPGASASLPESDSSLAPLESGSQARNDTVRASAPTESNDNSYGQPPEPEELFVKKYAELSWEALEEQRRALADQLTELTTPEGQALIAAGVYEVVGKGNKFELTLMDPTKVQCVVVPGADSEEDIKRVTFPRNLYPKFYEINDEVRWIEKRMVEVRSK